MQTSAPIDDHWLYIGDQPHLYPLARIESLHPTCAIVLADTNAARIMVFAAGEVVSQEEVTGVKTKRNSQGGWSQARYQRHIENFHLQHIKEVVEALEKIVQRENIPEIVVAGDEVVLPLLREQMPKHLQQKVVDHVRMNINSPLEQLIGTSLDALRRAHTEGEREKVDAAVGGFRSGGLGVIGPEDTLEALVKGQVDELLISSHLRSLQPVGAQAASTAADSLGAVLPEPVLEPIAAGEPAEADRGDGSPRRRARDQGDADVGEDHVHRTRGPARRLRWRGRDSEVQDLKVAGRSSGSPLRTARAADTPRRPRRRSRRSRARSASPTMTSKTVDCIQVRMRRP